MSIPVWPQINYLANQGSGSFAVSDGKARVSSPMDNGASRSRRRFTQVISPMTATIRLSYEELAIFEYFYRNVLFDGSRWFYMPVQRGNAYSVNLVMFDTQSNPSVSEIGFNVVDLSVNLLIRNATVISENVYNYFSRLGVNSGAELSEAVTRFTNTTYPHTSAEFR